MFHFKSIGSRLIFYVTLSVLAMFSVVVGLLLIVQYVLAFGMFTMTMSWNVDAKASAVEKRLVEVQTTILSHDVKVMSYLNTHKKLASVFQDILYNNNIHACGIALEPDSLTGERCLLYATRNSNGSVTVTQRPTDYAYENRDYYREAKSRMSSYWSDPYLDDTLQVSTFSQPLIDASGNFAGVLCADVLLDSIAGYVKGDPGTSNSYIVAMSINTLYKTTPSFILSSNGYFVIPPDTTVTFHDTYETYALRHDSPEFRRLGEAMVKRSGERFSILDEIQIEGTKFKIAHSYITKVGWTVVTLYPTENFKGYLTGFGFIILFLLCIGLALLILMIYMIVRRSVKPLAQLVNASKRISRGDFDVELPMARHRDEVQKLRDSFDDMRLSLKEYVAQLQTTTAHNERMEQDLKIASQIQVSMLSKEFPQPPDVPEVSLFAYMKPSREVGGDLYDCFIRRGHLHFVVGDVSGKGVPAAMIMAVTTSMFRALQRRDIAPERTVSALNNMLLERNTVEMFVTLVVGDMNLATGELSLCNAGHNPPVIMQGDRVQMLEVKKNIPIGVFPNYHYKADSFTVPPGARLLLYSDGATEATDGNETLFGEERLLAATRKYRRKDVEAQIGSMVSDINAFTGDTPQSDDITLMLIEYHGPHDIISREMQFANDMSEVARATKMIEEVCEELHTDPLVSTSLQLALEEAMANVVSYAYERGHANIDNYFKISSDGKSITFILSDCGVPFDPTKAATPDITLGAEERGVGGLGILLVKKIMDSVSYKRVNNRNILIMRKSI